MEASRGVPSAQYPTRCYHSAPLFQVPGRKPFDGGAQRVVLAPTADAYVRSLPLGRPLFLLPEVVLQDYGE